ncbi:MAG: L,D-transpeptidase family protein [Pseudomonadota bacterium]
MMSIRIKRIPAITLPFLVMIGALLSGCQTFPRPMPEQLHKVEERAYVPTHEFSLPEHQEMVGALAVIKSHADDTLPGIARHYGLGFNDIVTANPGIDAWAPAPGSRVLLPLQFILPDAPKKGVVLNRATMRLFYYPKNNPQRVLTYPVGIGRDGWETPTGRTRIVAKNAKPTWTPPASVRREHAAKGDPLPRVVPAGPDNPLGLYAMRLGFSGYLIHGTNKPYGVGMQISHGCVRLYPEDIETLFGQAAVGTPVTIMDQPYLTAWHYGTLYLEAHEPLQAGERERARLKAQVLKRLQTRAEEAAVSVDWNKVEEIIRRADGIPRPVLTRSPSVAESTNDVLLLAHPGRFYGQPEIQTLAPDQWSIPVAAFNDEIDAKRLAAMLSHQGPPIPARYMRQNESYLVVAGPFKDGKEARSVSKRIRLDFDLETEPKAPGTVMIN